MAVAWNVSQADALAHFAPCTCVQALERPCWQGPLQLQQVFLSFTAREATL
jgi:hypothetical protein